MLFKEKFANAKDYDQFAFDDTQIIFLPEKRNCAFCQQNETHFADANFKLHLCSEECNREVWKQYNEEMQNDFLKHHMQRYDKEMKEELLCAQPSEATKDIIIVVHDQLEYLKTTIESVLETTNNFHLWIWDNNSGEDTKQYLQDLILRLEDKLTTIHSDANMGFIEPNNELAALGDGDYIILLNSDVKVSGGWDQAMIGWLQNHQDTKIVGYAGGLLDEKGVGGRLGFGYDIDYVSGWCLCLSRETYDQYGLFNSDLKFAYAEDSELSIRLQAEGHRIYALHLLFVHHYENKTINVVKDEGEVDVYATFAYNHEKLREIWGDYLSTQRVDVRKQLKGEEALNEILGGFE